MNDSLAPLALLLSLLAIVWAAYATRRWLAAERALAAAQARAGDLEAARREAQEAHTARAAAETRSTERDLAAREREAALKALNAEIEQRFASLAAHALAESEQRFLTLANETFGKHQSVAAGGVKEVLAPVQEAMARLAESVGALDKARTEDRSALGEQMRQIGETLHRAQAATVHLTHALRGAPKARGRWGEETLKNVLELAGLSQRIDYTPEDSHQGEAGRLRPDVIIRLPGDRAIVVDAKVALSGYLDAVDAPDEATREQHLKKHAAELRQHVKRLASKEYWKHVPATADFVVMFVPGENFIAAACERDANLYQDAFADGVIIVGPSSLLALAKSIAYGWRQEEATKNAEVIAELGRELYARLSKFSQLLGRVGGAIEGSVKSYNELVGSFETRVVVTARKLKELGAAESGEAPVDPQPIERAPRLPGLLAEEGEPPPPAKRKLGR